MKIAIAQIHPIKGDIETNIQTHLRFIDLAFEHQANAIFFSELSLTSYEPTLAKQLAFSIEDQRLDIFQSKSDEYQITIGVGIPSLSEEEKPYISMAIFQLNQPRIIYSKQYLHVDELPYFSEGKKSILISLGDYSIAPAICFESLQPEHVKCSFELGANVYLASVAKALKNIQQAEEYYPKIAQQYQIPVLMTNPIGFCDNFECKGSTAVWDEQGEKVVQLDDSNEGLIIYDLSTKEFQEFILQNN